MNVLEDYPSLAKEELKEFGLIRVPETEHEWKYMNPYNPSNIFLRITLATLFKFLLSNHFLICLSY